MCLFFNYCNKLSGLQPYRLNEGIYFITLLLLKNIIFCKKKEKEKGLLLQASIFLILYYIAILVISLYSGFHIEFSTALSRSEIFAFAIPSAIAVFATSIATIFETSSN